MRTVMKWLIEPIVLPIWGAVMVWAGVATGMMLWIQHLTPLTEASFCFMDAVLWVDGLLNYWYGGIVSGQMEGDRPPLSLWMGAWLLSFGYTEVQALQLVARMAISALMATLTMGVLRRTSVLIAGVSFWLVLSSSSFSKLMLWLNAEMLVNALFVLHLFIGWTTLEAFRTQETTWRRRGGLLMTGLFAGWTMCAKEQGILLLPVSLLLMSILTLEAKQNLWKSIGQRVVWYLLGAIGPIGWYGVHFAEQWRNGEKWRIFIDDLRIMFSQNSLSDGLNAPTTWGTFSARFGSADSWWEFFTASSASLLQDMQTPTVWAMSLSIATILSAGVWNRLQVEKASFSIDWRSGLWIVGHLLPVAPLLLVPIFEPYHYTVLWAPVVVLLAWTAHQWMMRWTLSGVAVLLLMGHLASNGDPFERTIKLERESCIATRLIPVRMWMRQNASDRATLWVTDSLTPYDRSLYPQKALPFSKYQTCSRYDYVATSGLSNQGAMFAAERERFPGGWTKVNSIVSINKEVWQIYRADCKTQ